HRRDLERADQPEPGDIRRFHRGDVLPLVEDLAGRRLQEFGKKIEAHRLAGPVRTDQSVNRTPADFQRDIANGEKPRELLGQSVGFKNELIGQTNIPHRAGAASPIARGRLSFLSGWFSPTPWNVADRPPPRRNMPSS